MAKSIRRVLTKNRSRLLAIAALAAPLMVAAAPAPRPVVGVPSSAKIVRVMAHVHEAQAPSEFFAPSGTLLTTSGSDGTTLSAIVGTRSPSADGYGQLVFFFDGSRYVGTNNLWEATEITKIATDGMNRFRVTYAHYAPSDATFDPTLRPVTVIYTWNGTQFEASRTLPSGVGDKIEDYWLAEPTAPSATQLAATMAHVHEIQNPSEDFSPSGDLVLTSGFDGTMYSAMVGTRSPTADGYGQLVFFFKGNRYVGLNSAMESTAITEVQAYGPGRFGVTYANYTPKDPTVDPTLKPVTILYTWKDGKFHASAALPTGVVNKLSVHWVGKS